MINNELFKILNVEKIPYAVIEGKHDIDSYKVENVYTAAQQPPVAAKRKHTLPKLKMDVL